MMSFLREVFSDAGKGSASRVLMGFHAVIGAVWVTHVVFQHHALPDAVTMAGLTGFVTAPYALNALHRAVGALEDRKDAGGR